MVEPAQERVAVCVATYGRPEPLRRLLASLDHLTFDDETPEVEVVVVDNSPEGEVVADELGSRWALAVVHEPRPGIPFARNTAVRRALADSVDWLVFVDDDETVSPRWLQALLATARRAQVRLVTGPVKGVLPPEAPDWARRGGLFDRPIRPQGAQVDFAATNNLLVHAGVFDGLDHWFREDLADVGGSDTELTGRLRRSGERIVWASNAMAYEHWPPERMSVRWLMRRGFRAGTSRGRLPRLWTDTTPVELLRCGLHGAALILRGLALAAAGSALGRPVTVRGLQDCSAGLGVLAGLLGVRYREYTRNRR